MAAEIGKARTNAPAMSARAAVQASMRFISLASLSVIFSLSLSPFGDRSRIAVFPFFSCFFSFFCVSLSNRYTAVFGPFSGLSGGFRVSPLYCVCPAVALSPFLCLAVWLSYRGALCLFRACRFLGLGVALFCVSRGCPVAVSVGVCCCVAGPVCQGSDLEQVFDKPIRTSVSNKCSIIKSATFSGVSCQNFQPNLTEFQPNLYFESNRILTESRTVCR